MTMPPSVRSRTWPKSKAHSSRPRAFVVVVFQAATRLVAHPSVVRESARAQWAERSREE